MKNRTILAVVCIVLAMVILAGTLTWVTKLNSGKVYVAQVNHPVKAGDQLLNADLTLVEVGNYGISPYTITNPETVIGLYANTDIYPGTNLLPNMFTDNAYSASDILATLDQNHRAISITVPSYASTLAAKLKAGDIVSVIVTVDGKTEIPKALQYVKIISGTTSNGIDTTGSSETPPAVLTFYATELQAKMFAHYEGSKMHFALVTRGTNATVAQEYLDAQDVILEELLIEIAEEEKKAEEEKLLAEEKEKTGVELQEQNTEGEDNG